MPFEIPLYEIQLVRTDAIPWEEDRTCQFPRHVYDIYKSIVGDPDRECVLALFLDTGRQLIGAHRVSVGTMTAAAFFGREIYRAALLAGAATVIIAHNHVSGEPEPSIIDREATHTLEQAGGLLGVFLLDHVIVGHRKFYSFRERGEMSVPDPYDELEAEHTTPLGSRKVQ